MMENYGKELNGEVISVCVFFFVFIPPERMKSEGF